MADWVHNTVTITGSEETLTTFQNQAKQPYTRKVSQRGENGLTYEDVEVRRDFSLWNFVRPEDAILDEYFGEQPDNFFAESNHWYSWNNRHWGCKWDADDVLCDRESATKLVYSFGTPWSPPLPVFQAMIQAFPELDFDIRYLEAQGAGGEVKGSGGVYEVVDVWNEPETHAEQMKRVGYCQCEDVDEGADEDELEWLYDDCPKMVAFRDNS